MQENSSLRTIWIPRLDIVLGSMIIVLALASCTSDARVDDDQGWDIVERERDVSDMNWDSASDRGVFIVPDMTAADLAADSGVDMRPPLPGEPCTVDGMSGRCSVGLRYPGMARSECVAIYKPMPEICNGVDDDCDGITDPEGMNAPFREHWEAILRERGVPEDDIYEAILLACTSDAPCAAWFDNHSDLYHHQPPSSNFNEEFERFIKHSLDSGICLID